MDALEFAEKTSAETLDQVRGAYDKLHESVLKLATLVAGGAGGAGVYALGKIGTVGAHLQVWPLMSLSCWWFFIAGALLVRGAASNTLLAGTSSGAFRQRFEKHLKNAGAAGAHDTALWLTRWDELAGVDEQIELYAAAASRRARVLDRAYLCVVVSPIIAGIAYAFTMPR